jgi:benzoyl-CoA reductase/2-hydroxyglutaryl-CoA dehydratase subunit BcrC/BadD/HgdB
MNSEVEHLVSEIRDRQDYVPAIEPFVQTLVSAQSLTDFAEQAGRKTVITTCVHAPLELFHAAGVQPFKLACGSHHAGALAPLHLLALTCPVVKAMAGQLALEEQAFDMVIPTTCDWMVQFSRMADVRENSRWFWMELPRLRDNERASQRWLAEIKLFKTWLEAFRRTV